MVVSSFRLSWEFTSILNTGIVFLELYFDTLCEKSSNTEFFLAHIFPHSVQIKENTDQKKLSIWTVFAQWQLSLCCITDAIFIWFTKENKDPPQSRSSAKFTGKHLFLSLFFIKLQAQEEHLLHRTPPDNSFWQSVVQRCFEKQLIRKGLEHS